MYLPKLFVEARPAVLLALVTAHPFATLVVARADEAPEIAHLPLLAREDGQRVTLRGHVARANPLAALAASSEGATAIFHGPEGYVSAAWYEQPERQVPTWNYAVVHAHGKLRRLDSAATLVLLRDLTERFERDASRPWSMDLLDPAFVDALARDIVGFEIDVERLEGKLKLSQNRSPVDRARVEAALRARAMEDDLEMATMMASR